MDKQRRLMNSDSNSDVDNVGKVVQDIVLDASKNAEAKPTKNIMLN